MLLSKRDTGDREIAYSLSRLGEWESFGRLDSGALGAHDPMT